MTQEIFVKNIPLSYLKEKNDSFFDSSEFSNAELLFDKYKTKIDLSSNEIDIYDILPINELKLVLLEKYLNVVSEEENLENFEIDVSSDITQREDRIFIYLSGKKATSAYFKPRKFITSTIKDLKPDSFFSINMHLPNNAYQDKYDEAKENIIKDSTDISIDDLLKSSLKPKLTSNVSKDIANISNFYDKVLNTLVYDDIAYREFIKSEYIKDNLSLPDNFIAFKFERQLVSSVTNNYNQAEIELRLDNLKEKLKTKYFLSKYRDDVESHKNDISDSVDLNIFLSLLSYQNKAFPIEVFNKRILKTNSSLITIDNPFNSTQIALKIFDTESGDEIKISTLTYKVITEKTIQVGLPYNKSVNITIYKDKIHPNKINSINLLNYYRDTNMCDVIDIYKTKIVENKCFLNLPNYNKQFCLIEARDINHVLIPIDRVNITKKGILLEFNETSNIGMNLYILPHYKILGNVDKIKVTSDNIYEVLESVDLFEEIYGVEHD